jgi:oxygen-independent coproporphyrinogen-3 oxidase
MQPLSLYLHIPFCRHRCGYCDFNTYAGLQDLIPAYVEALITEIRIVGQGAGKKLPVHTVFFGGGTPSLLPASDIARILNAIGDEYALQNNAEISLEANPGTVSLDSLRGMRAAGVTRLSFGVQSANPEELRLLEREHDFGDVIEAVKWARQAGFDNLNLDWIFGLPGQTLESWKRNLNLGIELKPEHISLYALSIEHGTPFKEMSGRGLFPDLDSDLAADMYEFADERLDQAGYKQYEISNWAQLDGDGQPLACRHNLQYWRNLPYIGLGAGAHGFVEGLRTANVLAPAVYINRLKNAHASEFPRSPATANADAVDAQREMGETMMMGLRLVDEGVSREQFRQRFGNGLEEVYGKEIGRLEQRGLLESAADVLRLSKAGRLLGNQVFMEFV